jgi:hypothetical protein
MIGLMTLSISCKEQFTEEEALKAQQLVDFAMFVYNESSESREPVAGATVTFIQGSNKIEATTDESGVASFPDVKFGGFVYTISAENFTPVTDNEYIYADDLRTSQETYSVGIYSIADETLATMKGTIKLETDLTNDTRETMEGITLRFRVNLNTGDKVFTATTDAAGNYEVKVPVRTSGSSVYVQYPDILTGQKIAYNKLDSDPLNFPEVLPKVETVETLFAMYSGYSLNSSNYPTYGVDPIYAIADAAPTGQTTAVIDYVYTNADGEITDIDFANGGNYTGDADGKVTITFTSLLGGSGATLEITLGDQTNLNSAYNGAGTATKTLVGGTGYPDDNYSLNRTSYRGPTLNTQSREHSFYLYPGTITFNHQDYGTGVVRPDDLD